MLCENMITYFMLIRVLCFYFIIGLFCFSSLRQVRGKTVDPLRYCQYVVLCVCVCVCVRSRTLEDHTFKS